MANCIFLNDGIKIFDDDTVVAYFMKPKNVISIPEFVALFSEKYKIKEFLNREGKPMIEIIGVKHNITTTNKFVVSMEFRHISNLIMDYIKKNYGKKS